MRPGPPGPVLTGPGGSAALSVMAKPTGAGLQPGLRAVLLPVEGDAVSGQPVPDGRGPAGGLSPPADRGHVPSPEVVVAWQGGEPTMMAWTSSGGPSSWNASTPRRASGSSTRSRRMAASSTTSGAGSRTPATTRSPAPACATPCSSPASTTASCKPGSERGPVTVLPLTRPEHPGKPAREDTISQIPPNTATAPIRRVG